MTRAQRAAHPHAAPRAGASSASTRPTEPSRFLDEMPPELVETRRAGAAARRAWATPRYELRNPYARRGGGAGHVREPGAAFAYEDEDQSTRGVRAGHERPPRAVRRRDGHRRSRTTATTTRSPSASRRSAPRSCSRATRSSRRRELRQAGCPPPVYRRRAAASVGGVRGGDAPGSRQDARYSCSSSMMSVRWRWPSASVLSCRTIPTWGTNHVSWCAAISTSPAPALIVPSAVRWTPW